MKFDSSKKIAVIGLGYVGLPLAVEFSKKYKTIGFDISPSRVAELEKGFDSTLEVEGEELKKTSLDFTNVLDDIKGAHFYIVTVPTPIDEVNQPDLTPLKKVSKMLGNVLNDGDIVVYESTVYPGTTEEVCVPLLEQHSGKVFNKNFFVGYSPERINPGDKQHKVTNILKITSGSTSNVAEQVDALYSSIITAGTHKASSIKVAEAAKVIENTQRDVNIALINELAMIFNKLNIDTEEVLKAAGTKWNFLPFRPGLVGGHCIGVDPYYLTYKAQSVGYNPEIILAGRRLNDNMGKYVASNFVKEMVKKGVHIVNSRVLILGLTFKENCPDIRNTKVIDVKKELEDYGVSVDVFDPIASSESVYKEFGFKLLTSYNKNDYDGIILAVAHDAFKNSKQDFESYIDEGKLLYDLKYVLNKVDTSMRL